jgi:tetratricopeptide (TPR) repeat protein
MPDLIPNSTTMKCPVCRAIYRPSELSTDCRRCGVDLAPLINLYDLALWHHRQAIQLLESGDRVAAIAQNNQALTLHRSNADFHVLAGQLLALQGEFRQAIASWQKAQQLSPQHPKAGVLLQFLQLSEVVGTSANI